MAVFKYGMGPLVPKAPKVVPMGQSDIDAGSTAGSGFNIGIDFGSTGGRTSRASSSLAASNLTFKVGQAKAQAARNKAQAEYVKSLLAGTAYRAPIDTLLGKVGEEEKRQLGALDTQFAPAKENITKAYTTGTEQATAGYNALRNWLSTNAPQAYATATRAVATPIDNALAAYQRSQGISTAPTDAAYQLANLGSQGGAANYNSLLNTLAAASSAAQESRLAEEAMSRLATGNVLSRAQSSALANLAAQRAAAESGIRSQFGQTRLAAEQAAVTRRQALEDALRALQGY